MRIKDQDVFEIGFGYHGFRILASRGALLVVIFGFKTIWL